MSLLLLLMANQHGQNNLISPSFSKIQDNQPNLVISTMQIHASLTVNLIQMGSGFSSAGFFFSEQPGKLSCAQKKVVSTEF